MWFEMLYLLGRKPVQPDQGESQYKSSQVGEGTTPFPGLIHFIHDPYLITLSVKQGSIKFESSVRLDLELNPVSRALGEHSIN